MVPADPNAHPVGIDRSGLLLDAQEVPKPVRPRRASANLFGAVNGNLPGTGCPEGCHSLLQRDLRKLAWVLQAWVLLERRAGVHSYQSLRGEHSDQQEPLLKSP